MLLLYAVLVAALPLALACSCPPAPAASEVCGSDLVTYDSQCHLQCAAVQGLSLKHTGPCLATEVWERWSRCQEHRQCWYTADCGCGEDDYDCKAMCERNCECGCLGYPRGGMDKGLWMECYHRRRKCEETNVQCKEGCGGREGCEDQCGLERYKCACECQQQAYPAPQRKGNWTACLERRQCHNTTCGECRGAGPFCDKRCKRRCRCECAGWPRRDLSGEWEECFNGTQTCEQAHSACVRECGDQDDCKDKCSMARLDCRCACRSAEGEQWRLWGECKEDKQEDCEKKRCDCHEADTDCADRCTQNCLCGCLGINADRLDAVSVLQCQIDNGCQTTWENCLKDCDKLSDKAKRGECRHSCKLASEKCYCECARSRPPERVKIIQHCNFVC